MARRLVKPSSHWTTTPHANVAWNLLYNRIHINNYHMSRLTLAAGTLASAGAPKAGGSYTWPGVVVPVRSDIRRRSCLSSCPCHVRVQACLVSAVEPWSSFVHAFCCPHCVVYCTRTHAFIPIISLHNTHYGIYTYIRKYSIAITTRIHILCRPSSSPCNLVTSHRNPWTTYLRSRVNVD